MDITQSQQKAARVVGVLYLLTNVTASLAFYERARLLFGRDAAQVAKNIAASELAFRIAIATELLTIVAVIVLVAGLYVILKPIDANQALLATYWRLAENFVLAVAVLPEFAMIALTRSAIAHPADAHQLQALLPALIRVYAAAFNIGFAFLGLGSALFSYVWLKSRYVPRALAWLGIFASSVMAVVSLAIVIEPRLVSLGMTYMLPMGLYEIGLGLWLTIKGIDVPHFTQRISVVTNGSHQNEIAGVAH